MAEVLHWDNSNFAEATASGVVLVDFWATWCGPCRMLAPVLDQVAAEVGDAAKVGKVNIDEARELAIRFQVQNIPAIFILKDGKVVNQFVGVQTKSALVNAIRNA